MTFSKKKNFTVCERREVWNSFRFEVLHIALPEPQRKCGVLGARILPINRNNVDIWSLNVSFIAQKKLGYYQHLVSARFIKTFGLRFELAAICFNLRYSAQNTYIKLWQLITSENDFMKVKVYFNLKSDFFISIV